MAKIKMPKVWKYKYSRQSLELYNMKISNFFYMLVKRLIFLLTYFIAIPLYLQLLAYNSIVLAYYPKLSIQTSTDQNGNTKCYITSKESDIIINDYIINRGNGEITEKKWNRKYRFQAIHIKFGQKILLFTLLPEYELVELELFTNLGSFNYKNQNYYNKITMDCYKFSGNQYIAHYNTYSIISGKDEFTLQAISINRGNFNKYNILTRFPLNIKFGDKINLFTIRNIVVPYLDISLTTNTGNITFKFEGE